MMTTPLDEKTECDLCAGKAPVGDAVVCDGCGRAYLSATALPDELEVVAWQDEGDLTFPLVRLQDAAHALSLAHSVIEALKAANKALMAERTSLIETKRQQIAWLEEQARDDQREHVKLHKAAQAQVKRLTEEKEALRAALEALVDQADHVTAGARTSADINKAARNLFPLCVAARTVLNSREKAE